MLTHLHPFRKQRRLRRRCGMGDHPATGCLGRWSLAMAVSGLLRHQTGRGRSHRNRIDDLGPPQMFTAKMHPAGLHRSRMGKGLTRNRGHRLGVVAIGIVAFAGRPASRVIVVDIGDVGVVDHRFIADVTDVDIGEVAPAHPIRGHIDITRSKRGPADRAATVGNANTPVMAADEQNQGRRIHRPPGHLAGNPTPAIVHLGPPAVMKGRETPGRVVYPIPTPGIDPDPVAASVWRPADGDAGRIPDWTIAGLVVPGAVLIQVGIADHLIGNITARHGISITVGPGRAPAVESIGLRHIPDAITTQRRIDEAVGLAFSHAHAGVTVAVDHAVAGKDRHPSRLVA